MAAFIPEQAIHIAVVTASAATSATFAKGQRLAIISTTACYVTAAASPTAVVGSGTYVPANVPMELYISTDGFKLAAIRVSADGDLTIAPAVG